MLMLISPVATLVPGSILMVSTPIIVKDLYSPGCTTSNSGNVAPAIPPRKKLTVTGPIEDALFNIYPLIAAISDDVYGNTEVAAARHVWSIRFGITCGETHFAMQDTLYPPPSCVLCNLYKGSPCRDRGEEL
jgi:hypothetical protein